MRGRDHDAMRRKRLQHVAQNLCQMFCGWRLVNSYRDVERLGSGTLEVNALEGNCVFDGEPIGSTAIAAELQAWLEEDLRRNKIPATALRHARVTATLRLSTVNARDRVTSDQHFSQGKALQAGRFNRLAITCIGEVATDEAIYMAEYDDVGEWPVGWPDN